MDSDRVGVPGVGGLRCLPVARTQRLLGLIVDAAASALWVWFGRRRPNQHSENRGGETADSRHAMAVGRIPRDWHVVRSQLYLLPDTLEPWVQTQRQIWTSSRAASEFSDFQMQLQLSKATWFNVLLLWVVALTGLAVLGQWKALLAAGIFSGLATWGVWLLISHPPELASPAGAPKGGGGSHPADAQGGRVRRRSERLSPGYSNL